MKQIGIVGFGQFGSLAATHLKAHCEVTVHDFSDKRLEAETLGVTWGSLADACACEVVVLAVPAKVMREVLVQMAPLLRKRQVVVDVASVKTYPAQWMRELLPEHVELVATHPLFGPQSAKAGLAGLKLVVCPLRGNFHTTLEAFARDTLGLQVIVTTPEEHDREMAYVQALTHLIGRSLVNMNIPAEEMQTQSYRNLLGLCDLLRHDTWDLFVSLQTMNPFAEEITQRFRQEVNGLMAKVEDEKGAA
ncbi:MAG: prephenate dehydrogenase [Alphaproteobacteria bacterium]|nr:MAG: prephenate dehydrogenase [Alphaproteobacteria bacterium]